MVASETLLPAMRRASLSAFLIEREASSMLVMIPFLTPWDLAKPWPVTSSFPSSDTSAMTALILVDPTSMAKIQSESFYICLDRELLVQLFKQRPLENVSFDLVGFCGDLLRQIGIDGVHLLLNHFVNHQTT